MRNQTKEFQDSFVGAQFDNLRKQLEESQPNIANTVYAPHVTPAYDRLSLTSRMDLLLPTKPHLGNYTPLRSRQEVYTPNCELMELDLASYSPVGSFKYRGAWNAVASLPYETLLRHGVVTASAGNHAQGVALAVHRLNELFTENNFTGFGRRRVKATIFVPESAAPIKREHIMEIGGDDIELIISGRTYNESYDLAMAYMEYTPNASFIHPYDTPLVIDGQSSACYDTVKQLRAHAIDPAKTVIVVPVGGGGLISGYAKALLQLYPDATMRPKLIGAQLQGADSAARSWKQYKETGELAAIPVEDTINAFADGTAVVKMGEAPLPYLPFISDFITISNEDLKQGYVNALDSIAMNLTEEYEQNGIDPFFDLHEPASMIADVAATKYAETAQGVTVINVKTGSNYNPQLIEQILKS